MSFIQIKAVRAIKLYDKTYRSAKQAALAYSMSATHQHHWVHRERLKGMTGPQLGDWLDNARQKFYHRSLPIFERYFKGE